MTTNAVTTPEEFVSGFLMQFGKAGHRVADWMRNHPAPCWKSLESRLAAEGVRDEHLTQLYSSLVDEYGDAMSDEKNWMWLRPRLVEPQDAEATKTMPEERTAKGYHAYWDPRIITLAVINFLLAAMLLTATTRPSFPRAVLGLLVFVSLTTLLLSWMFAMTRRDVKKVWSGEIYKNDPDGQKRREKRYQITKLLLATAFLLAIGLTIPYRGPIVNDAKAAWDYFDRGGLPRGQPQPLPEGMPAAMGKEPSKDTAANDRDRVLPLEETSVEAPTPIAVASIGREDPKLREENDRLQAQLREAENKQKQLEEELAKKPLFAVTITPTAGKVEAHKPKHQSERRTTAQSASDTKAPNGKIVLGLSPESLKQAGYIK